MCFFFAVLEENKFQISFKKKTWNKVSLWKRTHMYDKFWWIRRKETHKKMNRNFITIKKGSLRITYRISFLSHHKKLLKKYFLMNRSTKKTKKKRRRSKKDQQQQRNSFNDLVGVQCLTIAMKKYSYWW